MRRREFIGLLGGAATAWPLWAHAQVPRAVGYISSRSQEADAQLVAAFRHGLAESGYVEGQNVSIEFRWAAGDYQQHEALTADLVRRRVNVIVATSAPTAAVAKKVHRGAIPLVFTSGRDPVKEGLVASFDKPGGDATGVYVLTTELGAKRLQILRELVPRAAVIGFLMNSGGAAAAFQINEIRAAGRAMDQQIKVFTAGSEDELNTAFDAMAQAGIGALLLGADPFFQVFRSHLIGLAARHRIPTMYEWTEFVVSGGLASYSTNRAEAYRLAGTYAGRILNGENPADLPVVLPVKFELAINLRTARALSMDVPPALIARADEVIE